MGWVAMDFGLLVAVLVLAAIELAQILTGRTAREWSGWIDHDYHRPRRP